MIIGIPKEIKNNENRVSMTPAGVFALCKAGHQVYVDTMAGTGSGFNDDEYKEAGAIICSCDEVFAKADLIVKVKEYLESYRYYHFIRHWYMQRFRHTIISTPMYMIILHDKNSYGNYKNIAPRVFGTEQVLSNWQIIKQQYHL